MQKSTWFLLGDLMAWMASTRPLTSAILRQHWSDASFLAIAPLPGQF